MYTLHLILYLLRYAFYQAKLLLFRLYVFLVFLMRPGAAWVMACVISFGFYWLKEIEADATGNLLGPLADMLTGWREQVLLLGPFPEFDYNVVAGFIAFLTFFTVRLFGNMASRVFFAFPMPRRPLPPIRPLLPPKHKIEAVQATIVTPRRNGKHWDGNWEQIVPRLKPELQKLLSDNNSN